jgi:tetratricopeptide (TPR) repeat protein
VSVSLDKVAGLEEARGDLDSALSKYEESLSIRRALADELDTPDNNCDVAFSLDNVAGILQAKGDLGAALPLYEESLQTHQAILAPAEEPASVLGRAISVNEVLWSSCQVAQCAIQMGNTALALDRLLAAESLLAHLEHPNLEDTGRIDTAATWHELRSRIAECQNHDAVAATHRMRGQTLRQRIAHLESQAEPPAD